MPSLECLENSIDGEGQTEYIETSDQHIPEKYSSNYTKKTPHFENDIESESEFDRLPKNEHIYQTKINNSYNSIPIKRISKYNKIIYGSTHEPIPPVLLDEYSRSNWKRSNLRQQVGSYNS